MQGNSLEKTIDVAQGVIPRIRLLAFLDSLHYLWKGGRVPRIAHAGASLLRIKPLFELSQGEVQTLARPRTHKRAMRRLLELMRERVAVGRLHAAVMHVEAEDAAEELRRQVEAEFSCEELHVSEFTPTMGAHIGPGLLGNRLLEPIIIPNAHATCSGTANDENAPHSCHSSSKRDLPDDGDFKTDSVQLCASRGEIKGNYIAE